MRSLRYILFLSFFVFSLSYSQHVDLCGVWFGLGYTCHDFSGNGSNTSDSRPQLILIEMDGPLCTATKIIGDDCVPTGSKTWEGIYDRDVFPVMFQAGSPTSPNAIAFPETISVVNKNLLESSAGISFVRATCEELGAYGQSNDFPPSYCQNKPSAASIQIQNVFSPNGDGINDEMHPIYSTDIATFQIFVYDRWGATVFESNQLGTPWNGKLRGLDCSEGVYFWVVNFTTSQCGNHRMNGTLMLVR